MEYTWDNFKRGSFAVVCHTRDESISFLRLAKEHGCNFRSSWKRNLSDTAKQCYLNTRLTYKAPCAYSHDDDEMGYCYPGLYANHIDFTDFCGEPAPSVQIKSLDELV